MSYMEAPEVEEEEEEGVVKQCMKEQHISSGD